MTNKIGEILRSEFQISDDNIYEYIEGNTIFLMILKYGMFNVTSFLVPLKKKVYSMVAMNFKILMTYMRQLEKCFMMLLQIKEKMRSGK